MIEALCLRLSIDRDRAKAGVVLFLSKADKRLG
jgi:hypothetical protein